MLSIPTRFTLGLLARALGFALAAAGLSAQQQQPPMVGDGSAPAAQEQSGSATAGVFAPVLDSERRPITRGGFVKTGPIVFQDVSRKGRSQRVDAQDGRAEKPFILETIGSGVCLLDYDNDGWLDIYIVNGSTYDALDGKAEPPHAALFHNNHDGTFTNVAKARA